MTTTKIDRRLSSLHPEFVRVFTRLHESLIRHYEAGTTKTRFEIFETFRTPERQRYLLSVGTTKAGPGQSAHNFGLAVDFVPCIDNGTKNRFVWSWSAHHDWKFLQTCAVAHGLCNQGPGLRWDKPHVQVCDWRRVVERTG